MLALERHTYKRKVHYPLLRVLSIKAKHITLLYKKLCYLIEVITRFYSLIQRQMKKNDKDYQITPITGYSFARILSQIKFNS